MSDTENQVLKITERCLAASQFTFRTICNKLDVIAELGKSVKAMSDQDAVNETIDAIEANLSDVSGLTSLTNGPINRLSTALVEHKKSYKFLSEYMQKNGEDLEEVKKTPKEITVAAMLLLERMILALYIPQELTGWFIETCQETSPFEYGMKLAELVETDGDYLMTKKNYEMEADESMMFMTWRRFMDGFLSQLLFIEAFSAGLSGDGDLSKANKLRNRIEAIYKEWYESDEEHESTEFELESIRSIVEMIQDNNPKKTCEEKAAMIQTELESLENVGDDLFYILVFPTSDGYVYNATLPDQVLTSLNRGQCHVIVYRSREAKSASKKELKRMENQVASYKALLRLLTLKLFVTQSQVDKWAQEIENNGFVIALKASNKAAIRSTKTDVLKWGPGWWVHETILLGVLIPTKYMILAGYK